MVKRLRPLGEVDRALEDAAIHVRGDQSFAKLLQRALGKCRVLGPQTPQDHLHAQVDHGQFDHLGIGNPQVALHEHRHRHHRGRQGVLPRTRRAVHRRQLILKCLIEQLVPMPAQKPQELSYATQALQQKLFLPGRRHRRLPTRDRHPHASSGHRDRVGPRVHQITDRMISFIERSDLSHHSK